MRIFLLLLLGLALVLAPLTAAPADGRCVHCGSVEQIEELPYRGGDRSVCYLCRERLEKCSLCSQPSKAQPGQDGRRICKFCRANSVFSQNQLETIYKQAQQFINSELAGLAIKPPPPVKLVDLDELQTKANRGSRALPDVLAFYNPYNPEEIYVLSGIEPDECGGVMVHEYTHAWQSRNCPSQDRALSEGFATWVQYRYLMKRGRRDLANNLTYHGDADYGAALNSLLSYEKKHGAAKVIEYARSQRDLP